MEDPSGKDRRLTRLYERRLGSVLGRLHVTNALNQQGVIALDENKEEARKERDANLFAYRLSFLD